MFCVASRSRKANKRNQRLHDPNLHVWRMAAARRGTSMGRKATHVCVYLTERACDCISNACMHVRGVSLFCRSQHRPAATQDTFSLESDGDDDADTSVVDERDEEAPPPAYVSNFRQVNQ